MTLLLDGIEVARGRQTVLAGVTLHVASGETVVLMGRSGIGKTSLLHAAAGLLPLSAGRITVNGRLAMVFPGLWLFCGASGCIGHKFSEALL